MRDRITPHFLVILRLPGIELCSNVFQLMFYWHSKLFKGFDSYELCSNFSLQYLLIFSAFLPLPSHLPPLNIPAAEQQAYYKGTFILNLPNRLSCKLLRTSGTKAITFCKCKVVFMQQFPPLRGLYKDSVHKPSAFSACQKSEASVALDSPIQHIYRQILHPRLFKQSVTCDNIH